MNEIRLVSNEESIGGSWRQRISIDNKWCKRWRADFVRRPAHLET